MVNFVSPLEFNFTIQRLPNVTFVTQAATVPGLNLGTVEHPSPFKNLPIHGDKIEYDDLTVTIKLDSELKAWDEVVGWMKGLAAPEEFNQHSNLIGGDGLYSDGTLHIMSNKKNPKHEFIFEDMFPVNIGPLMMDTRTPDIDYISVDITFKFLHMKRNILT